MSIFDITPEGPKAMDFLIRFFGYVIPSKRIGTLLPEVVFFDKIIRVNSQEQLDFEINREAAMIIIKQRGMVVFKNQNPGSVQQGDNENFIGRMFVPMEMFSHIDCAVDRITGETPNHADGQNAVGEGINKKELKAN